MTLTAIRTGETWQLPGVRLRTAIAATLFFPAMLAAGILFAGRYDLTTSPLAARVLFLVVAIAGSLAVALLWRMRRVRIDLTPRGVLLRHAIGSRLTPWSEIETVALREGVFGVRIVLRAGDRELDDVVVAQAFTARADEVVAAIAARL